MKVRIAVQHAADIAIDANVTMEELTAEYQAALAQPGGLLTLADAKGHRVIVPAAGIAYVEVRNAAERPVGFAGF